MKRRNQELITFLGIAALLILPSAGARASIAPDGPISLHAAGRGRPWINLLDGKGLPAVYRGPRALVRALEAGKSI